ncbi:MAG: flagellar basal body P-ring formation protein FlgA, partial [Magnetococcales bacterium]|nr:flagellar basal body P-ring formation protein FlgA [Magnetococcales bacterium]
MIISAQTWGVLLVTLGLFWHEGLHARQVERSALAGLVEKQLAVTLAQRGDGFVASRVFVPDGVEIGDGSAAANAADKNAVKKAADGKTALEKGIGSLSVTFDLPATALEPGRREIPVTVLEEGAVRAQIRIFAVLQQEKNLLVLRRPIQRNEVVREGDLEEKPIVLARSMPGVVEADQLEKVQGRVAKRALTPGVPLQASWFESPAAVDRGEQVRVRLNRGGL